MDGLDADGPDQHLAARPPRFGIHDEVGDRPVLVVDGEVESPIRLSWDELNALPRTEHTQDIHCVTRWSRFDTRFEGVHWRELAKLLEHLGFADVAGMDDIGFPIAEIAADGSCIVGKAAGTGGLVDCRTVKEQLLYEVHDPAAYLTPDVVCDITQASVEQVLDAWDETATVMEDAFGPISLLNSVHPDKEVRDASDVALIEESSFLTDVFQNEALYERVRLVHPKSIAEKHGYRATFMPKPFSTLTGSGCPPIRFFSSSA